jgi:hypothetical protein
MKIILYGKKEIWNLNCSEAMGMYFALKGAIYKSVCIKIKRIPIFQQPQRLYLPQII